MDVNPATESSMLGGRGWHWISFAVHTLAAGEGIAGRTDGYEIAIVVLEGTVRIITPSRVFDDVGSRASVFEPIPAPVVLLGPATPYEIQARTDVLVAIAGAPAAQEREPWFIEPSKMRVEARGVGQTARIVRHLLPPEADASRLILVEVFTPGGNWSSYPPHKHDVEDQPRESLLEELYYYRFSKPQGFATQRIYTSDRSLDEVVAPMHGDTVLVPRGFHPVGVAAGYDCYYLNVMAGPSRLWNVTLDADHAWLMDWATVPDRE